MNAFHNLYLLASLRGTFAYDGSLDLALAEAALLDALPDRWGVPAPWGRCDSGADLETPGDGVVRGWSHVDLRLDDDSPLPNDVPLAGLVRTMWDALELFGTCTLSGVDAMLPLECVGDAMALRVDASMIRHRVAVERPARVVAQVTEPWKEAPRIQLDRDAMAAELSEVVAVEAVMGDVPHAAYPDASGRHPFGPAPWAGALDDPLRVEITLPVWSIDDAAWLAEAVALSCARAGCTTDIELALRQIG